MESCRKQNSLVIKLIEAVKVRPVLWDTTRAEYRSHRNKDKVWQDVFEELNENYRFMNENERSVFAMKITTKWRNIRDVFIRSIKKRATAKKMKKYMYHDRLSFMLKLYKSYLRPDSPSTPVKFIFNSFHKHKAQRSISFDNVTEISSIPAEEETCSIKTEPNDNDGLTNDRIEPCSSSRFIVTDFNNEESESGNVRLQNRRVVESLKNTQPSISFQNAPDSSLHEKPKTSVCAVEENRSIKTELDESDEFSNDGIEECSSSRNLVTHFDDEFDRMSCSENQPNRENESGTVQLQSRKVVKSFENGLRQSSSGVNFENIAIVQPDEDEAFLTSILSSVRDMNLDEKLEFRIAVLQKISDIRSKRNKS